MHKEKNISKLVLEAVLYIKQEIDAKPLQRKSIPKLTGQFNIGRNILNESYREITGKTIIRYQLEKRMEAACEMLKDNEMNIQQVALKCKYKDQGNFSTDFKKVYNKTPSEWLKEYLNNTNTNMNTRP